MKKLLLCLSLMVGLSISTSTFAQKTDAPKYLGNVEGVKEYSLNNGMKVLLIPDGSQSNMVVNIVYNVGSKDEGYGEKGMAHLLEHMLFKSTKNLGDIKKQLSDKGGAANGTTYYDRTNYYEIFPSNDENLKWAIQMEADRMINATILQSDLDKEFSVVRNEFEIGENNPSGVLMEKVFSTAYMWHNYGNSTIGSKEDIERVKAPTLRKFYEKYYQPDNATLIIAGKFDEANALKHIAENFSVLPKPTRQLGGTYTVEPAQDGEKTVELNRSGESKLVAAAYHTSAYADKDYAALAALGEILTADPSGYLYKSLVETQKVSSIWVYAPEVRDAGLMYFNFDVPKDKNLEVTKNLVRTELDKIGSIKYNAEDLGRAKSKLLKQIADNKNNTVSFAISLTEIIGAGDYKLAFLYRDNVENLSVADIQRVAEKYFKSNNRTLGVFVPSANETRVQPAEFRPEQIAALTGNYKGKALEKDVAPFEATIANLKKNVTEGVLSNGMKYGLINKEVKGDKIIATFKMLLGNEKDLAGKNEIGKLTAVLLKSGTKTKTKEQIQDRLDQLKSSINTRLYGQNFIISVNTYKNNYAEVMDILKDMVTNSTFPQNEITKTITEQNTNLEGQLKDPEAIAQNELQRLSSPYPKESVFYTASLQEQIDNSKKVTRDQIVNYYQNILGTNNGLGTVLGNIEAKNVVASLENTFGKWNAQSKYAEVKPTYFETKKLDKNFLTPDKENAIALGTESFKMNQKSPDYPAFVLANEILGSGGFLSARLPMRLREKEGISYGVGSFINIPVSNDVASWGYYALLNPTKRNAVESAIKEEVSKALKDGFTADELLTNKKSYANIQKTMLGMDNTLINLVNKKLQYGISLDEYDTLNSKIADLKLDEVNSALRKYLTLDKVTSVYAGDFNKK
ncbi:M16 family metallopeptidase [Kaistella antarctica]|uniref:Peptidase M16 n=1 Tax=Kaistella antarctica TaxID=266748 RepID=A0A3S4UV27_9FLAO|nr:pitrilysin family protein [Kaistella antarctica]KEY18445.1 peptidase M16 [Kaistella antarctica]SEV85830.1 zinc protease [Kaistella antarctica]VEI01217.1 protease3 [Kaistella antarctica]